MRIVKPLETQTIQAESEFGDTRTMTLSRTMRPCVTMHLHTDHADSAIILTNAELSALYETVCALLVSDSRKMNDMVPDRVFESEGDKLTFGYTNMGEPYREGMDVSLDLKDEYSYIYMFFEKYEVRKIKEVIEKLLDSQLIMVV